MTDGQTLRHGGALDVVEQLFPEAPRPWIDLSTGINPWPWPVPQDILAAQDCLTTLPTQRDWDACKAAMARSFDVPEAYVLPVPGSAMAIALLPKVIPARTVACLEPSYGDHKRVWHAAGARVEALGDHRAIGSHADVAVLCNPNNPDGRCFGADDLLAIAETIAEREGYLIVDEAYGELAPHLSLAQHVTSNRIIVLRSFGKFYGLGGVRLGAVVADPSVLERLARCLGDWPISTLALRIGAAAYGDTVFAEDTRTRLANGRTRLDAILQSAGLSIAGGTDLFRLVEAGDADALWTHLAQAGIYVRRFDWSPSLVRIGLPATQADETRLENALMAWQHL